MSNKNHINNLNAEFYLKFKPNQFMIFRFNDCFAFLTFYLIIVFLNNEITF